MIEQDWSSGLAPEHLALLRLAFDSKFYLESYPDIRNASADPLEHFMEKGWREMRNPSPDFSTRFYIEDNDGLIDANENPFLHWLLHGRGGGRRANAGRNTSAIFLIRERYPRLTIDEADAVASAFDDAFYARKYPDVVSSGQEMIRHYLEHGWREHRDPSVNFSTSAFLSVTRTNWREIGNPFIQWVLDRRRDAPAVDAVRIRDRWQFEDGNQLFTDEEVAEIKTFFDPEFYAANYLDPTFPADHVFEHFMTGGWRLLNDPSPDFSVKYYLSLYEDIKDAGINPLAHWVQHGRKELRRTLSYHNALARKISRPDVSAIILMASQQPRHLSRLAQAIVDQTYTAAEVIFVVENSSEEQEKSIRHELRNTSTQISFIVDRIAACGLRKACEVAVGEIIWVHGHAAIYGRTYLERLVPYFKDFSVTLAFGRLVDIDIDTDSSAYPALQSLEKKDARDAFVRPAAKTFSEMLGVTNIDSGMGGFLWRRAALHDEVWQAANVLDVAAVPFLQIGMAAGGQIAWDPNAISVIDRSDLAAAVASRGDMGALAHAQWLMIRLKQVWSISAETVDVFADKMRSRYLEDTSNDPRRPFHELIDTRKINAHQRFVPHVLLTFWGFTPGGGELFPVKMANELHRKGYLVSMLGFEFGIVNPDLRNGLNRAVAVYDANWVDEYGADRFMRDAGISIVHSHTVGSEFRFFDSWDIEDDIPYLVTLHGSYEASDIVPVYMHKITERVSHFVYTADKNLLPLAHLDLPSSRFTKLPNAMPVDDRVFPKSRRDLQISGDAVVFTLVARGVPEKGWQTSIDAFTALKAARPDVDMHLLLCGGGDEPDRLMKIHGDDPSIGFLGFQSCVHGLYRLSDVCLVPSRFSGESAPLCIIQALQCGTPVIGSRVGEIPSMISPPDDNAAGIVIDACEDDGVFSDGLLRAMEAMLDHDRRSNYSDAASLLGRRYDIGKLVDRYTQLYQSLLVDAESGRDQEGGALSRGGEGAAKLQDAGVSNEHRET